MSPTDGYDDEMARIRRLSDPDLDRLLAGDASADDEDLGELAEAIRAIKAASGTEPDRAIQARHLALMAEDIRNLDPTIAGGSPTHPAVTPSTPRRKSMLSTLFASLSAKIAAASFAAVAATGGLAAAGALPDPAQQAVADAAAKIGLHLPSPEDDASTQQHEAPEVGPVNEDVQGVLEDDSLEGRDKGDAVSDAADQNRQDDGTNPTGAGEPESTPSGAPESTPSSAPESTPSGEPDGTPSGKPASTPSGRP